MWGMADSSKNRNRTKSKSQNKKDESEPEEIDTSFLENYETIDQEEYDKMDESLRPGYILRPLNRINHMTTEETVLLREFTEEIKDAKIEFEEE